MSKNRDLLKFCNTLIFRIPCLRIRNIKKVISCLDLCRSNMGCDNDILQNVKYRWLSRPVYIVEKVMVHNLFSNVTTNYKPNYQ